LLSRQGEPSRSRAAMIGANARFTACVTGFSHA